MRPDSMGNVLLYPLAVTLAFALHSSERASERGVGLHNRSRRSDTEQELLTSCGQCPKPDFANSRRPNNFLAPAPSLQRIPSKSQLYNVMNFRTSDGNFESSPQDSSGPYLMVYGSSKATHGHLQNGNVIYALTLSANSGVSMPHYKSNISWPGQVHHHQLLGNAI